MSHHGRSRARDQNSAGGKLRWTWRNGRLAAHPKVVDLRVAGSSASLAVPKSGEPEGCWSRSDARRTCSSFL